MKKTFLVLAAVLALSAYAFARDAALVGTWKSAPIDVGGGLTLQFDATFTPDGAITLGNTCTQGAVSVHVAAKGTYETNGNQLVTTGNSSDHQSQGGVTCDVSITGATIPYSVSGSTLTLSEGGQSISLSKTN